MDALTGCFTAFQSPELREQISEPNLFPGYLLLVNTAIFVKDTWAWAQSREAQSNSSLKSVSLCPLRVLSEKLISEEDSRRLLDSTCLPSEAYCHCVQRHGACTLIHPLRLIQVEHALEACFWYVLGHCSCTRHL